ncbi:MAG TPA: 2OG-Fe(II) oxygenase [Allosphingosinicella sp.]|nr:2OG-Fe(II) oxygenase [Allosphingosinicella sp.]
MRIFHVDCPDAFSGGECDAIVALATVEVLAPGQVWGEAGYHVDPAFRDVATSYHPRSGDTAWIYDRLDALFARAAEALEVEVGTMAEPLQIMRYAVGSHFRTWHTDAGTDRLGGRILSVSVELSDLADYAGGNLEIVPHALGPRTLPRGGARIFPSRTLHRVTPVTRGVRFALVNWVGAPSA